jgi:hypothetical protein
MAPIEITTNLLDIGAFLFVTPELIGKTNIVRYSDKMTRFTMRETAFGFRWWGLAALINRFMDTIYGVIYSTVTGVGTSIGLLYWMINDSNAAPTLLPRLILSPFVVIGFLGFLFRLWLYMFARYDISKLCLLYGAGLFLAARVVGLIAAVSG